MAPRVPQFTVQLAQNGSTVFLLKPHLLSLWVRVSYQVLSLVQAIDLQATYLGKKKKVLCTLHTRLVYCMTALSAARRQTQECAPRTVGHRVPN